MSDHDDELDIPEVETEEVEESELPKKLGRPSKYTPSIHVPLVLWMARSGLTAQEMADELEISKETLYQWGKRDEQIKKAMRAGRDWFDAAVEDRLFRNATGFNTSSVSEEWAVDPDTGEKILVKQHVTKTEHPPNVTAQIFWLKNRQPTKWRDKHEVDLTANVAIGLPPSIEDAYPDEEESGD